MTALLHGAQQVVDLLHSIERVRAGASLDASEEFEWTTAFGVADIKQLADEIYAMYASVRKGERPLDELEAVIHEWQESAWAVRSSGLKAAFEAADCTKCHSTVPDIRE